MATATAGFVGLGIMGLPMAKNLLDAGYDVVGHNRSAEPVGELVAYGGEDGGSPAGVAERSDVVFLCLPDSPAVEDVVLGEGGEPEPVIDGVTPGTTLIDHSTISPTVAEAVAERLGEAGVDALDAPISGGESGAIEGTLSIMVGGDEDVLEEWRDALEVMGETVTHCGPSGAGQTTKACNQIVVSAQMVAVSEALVFAHNAGADLQAVVDAISGGAAGCWTLDNRAESMIRGDFDPGFFAEYQYKDLRIATDAGEAFGSPMPQTELAHELYKSMVQNDMGRDDNSGVMQVLELLAGEEARIDGAD
ncbi:NAD(P)-dependent oxidoreductase [Halorubrum halodurans]|uniref:2-hydroxy-3-oxopropionate reductase n=1 Tax=Halorubrum halodurans TaxID=1383851 RepID=A0A256IMM1_9EURY|nr:NAD(P)-dependent oxidoreductase [Halorubrum halodurans]OYR57775.1 2-hydroxy-3-oxopropionate reductase [Halorubrum halodurans]